MFPHLGVGYSMCAGLYGKNQSALEAVQQFLFNIVSWFSTNLGEIFRKSVASNRSLVLATPPPRVPTGSKGIPLEKVKRTLLI